ncbi:uncharacterized protein LOC110476528 [Lonchura striata]|uniref:uncharacterized protein n=1 Tax=Lonchura striata TaxID=40157 RepID=UPI000B4D7CF5|nr:uncharacterized protein LOC110476528 [Lonchura striata domestica]
MMLQNGGRAAVGIFVCHQRLNSPPTCGVKTFPDKDEDIPGAAAADKTAVFSPALGAPRANLPPLKYTRRQDICNQAATIWQRAVCRAQSKGIRSLILESSCYFLLKWIFPTFFFLLTLRWKLPKAFHLYRR